MLWPITAGAFDAVNFTWPEEAAPEVRDSVKAVSVLAELETREDVQAADVLAAAQGDYARIVEALYAQGYYGPVVRILLDGREAATIPPFEAPKAISRAQIVVEPGPRFRFGTAQVAPRAKSTPETEGFDSGEPARATAVRAAAQDAVDGWRQKGHATAAITGQQITARHDAAELDVAVQVDPGPVYTFGEVRVDTQSAVKPARIRQIAGIPRGETFDPDAVEKGAERLRATGTFRSVVLNEEPKSDSTLDVLVEVTDRKPRRLGFGAELSSTEGLTLSSFWLHRNLLGGAERFRVDAEVRQLAGTAGMNPDYELSARFEKPAVYGADTLFYATAKLAYEEEPDYISRSVKVGLGVSQEFTDTITGELGFTLSRSEITDLYLPGDPVRRLNVFAMPSALTWDTRDSTTDATLGAYVRLDTEPFTLLSGGNASGMHFTADARGYKSFGKDDGVTMALRLQLGSLYGIDAANAPPEYLFHSGGGGTVRGQPYQSLDATYANGTQLGGRSFVGVSAEARVDVTAKIGVVAFADTGYIGPESFYDDSGSWHSGAGLGVRYATPVGPIRFDVAAPVGGDTGDGVQLYIGIGQSF
ncbi:autotransporter assembly complex protein TamA [Sagittula salina]|uniref:Outer membrane protein assembly factor n=1 Tax=Sagittula salina TaxID=2820268 RepID=A0A940MQF8_9RHOB|nr:autotransporter assembly complex family protein [Sagittula salina]MBP0481184.1 outer membrane protein assembly factor [Sagittula salina]